jgi:hypothetical protein
MSTTKKKRKQAVTQEAIDTTQVRRGCPDAGQERRARS